MLSALSLATVYNAYSQPDINETQRQLERSIRRGDYRLAQELAEVLLRANPDADDTRLTAAECAELNGQPQAAIEHLSQITSVDREIQVAAGLLSARILHERLFDLRNAESTYKKVLSLDPSNPEALTGIVRLLAVCGRRREALPCLLKLVQIGEASDLLMIAARASGSISDLPLLTRCQEEFPDDGRALLGLAMHAAQDNRLEEAIVLCRRAVSTADDLPVAHAALGQHLVEAQRFDDLKKWHSELPQSAMAFAETWQVLGQYFEHNGQRQQALQAFLTAASLGPDLKVVHHRLSLLFRAAGDDNAASVFEKHLQQLQQLETQQGRLFSIGPESADVLITAIRGFESAGRLWEAYGWAQLGLSFQPDNFQLQQLLTELATKTGREPLQLVRSNNIPALNFSADDYQLADFAFVDSGAPVSVNTFDDNACDGVKFSNDAISAGLQFRFHNGVVGPTSHRMFEFTGGGIGILDLDMDDLPDVYLTQGGLWKDRGTSDDAQDIVFRNRHGARFESVSHLAGIHDRSFGQGVAVGDTNNDGFPDVFVANIGVNTLWINNGDGTFVQSQLPAAALSKYAGHQEGSTPAPDDEESWTTSAAIADLNGDGAADIFATNYLQGTDLFDRICYDANGDAQACIPIHFNAAADQLLINDLNGSFENQDHLLASIEPGKGLGVLAWAPSNDGRIALLVANDTTANMLLTFQQNDQNLQINDIALQAGVALSGEGKAEGCMGIAAADLNADGLTDLLVTNFYNESNTLYQSMRPLSFDDSTRRMNLQGVSMPVLGFGTQFLDANLDAVSELFVANGHVDDLRRLGKPYQMPAHLFCIQNNQFEQLQGMKLGDYFQHGHLGRAAVVLDWNRDQRPDLLIGHLSEDYALLTNKSRVAGKAVTIRLCGVRSSRDAIGTTISYQINGKTIMRQLTAGDGYQCSNQHRLILSCGDQAELNNVKVIWPTGAAQSIEKLEPDRAYVVIEESLRCVPMPVEIPITSH